MRILPLIALVCTLPHSAIACSFDDQGAPKSVFFGKAKSVFLAHITSTKEKFITNPKNQTETFPTLEATFQVLETYKGTPPDNNKVSDAVPGIGNCSIGLVAGWDYVFFIAADDQGDHDVGLPTGSFTLGDALTNQTAKRSPPAQKALDEIRALSQKQTAPKYRQ